MTTELFNRREQDEILWVKPTGAFTIDEKKHDGTLTTEGWFLSGRNWLAPLFRMPFI